MWQKSNSSFLFTFRVLLQLILIVLSLLTRGCAGDPDPDAPGVCKLSCAGAKLGSTEMEIVSMTGDSPINISCSGIQDGDDYIGTVPLRFMIQKKRSKLPAETLPGDSSASTSASSSASSGAAGGAVTSTAELTKLPLSGVSFEALVVSGYLSEATNPDDEFKYQGIVTPTDEWCTDSCGTGAVDIMPMCKQGLNPITILVHSGPIYKTFTVNVTP